MSASRSTTTSSSDRSALNPSRAAEVEPLGTHREAAERPRVVVAHRHQPLADEDEGDRRQRPGRRFRPAPAGRRSSPPRRRRCRARLESSISAISSRVGTSMPSAASTARLLLLGRVEQVDPDQPVERGERRGEQPQPAVLDGVSLKHRGSPASRPAPPNLGERHASRQRHGTVKPPSTAATALVAPVRPGGELGDEPEAAVLDDGGDPRRRRRPRRARRRRPGRWPGAGGRA